MELRGKVTVITGASEGIGAACAQLAHDRGARLALVARSGERLARIAPPNSLVIPADLSEPDQRVTMINRVVEHFGHIDLLINNAGQGLYGATADIPLTEARQLFEINFFAALHICQLAIPHMGGGACIANIGSVASKMTVPWSTLYSATKYALDSLSDGLRMELAPKGIHVLSVCPGHVRTGFQSHAMRGKPPGPILTSRNRFIISAEECARDIVRAIEREARTIVTPAIYWLPILVGRFFPGLIERRFQKMLQIEDDDHER
jgi:short-subunit dehydrogenase